jgi:hypothetical protein
MADALANVSQTDLRILALFAKLHRKTIRFYAFIPIG